MYVRKDEKNQAKKSNFVFLIIRHDKHNFIK